MRLILEKKKVVAVFILALVVTSFAKDSCKMLHFLQTTVCKMNGEQLDPLFLIL